MALSLATASALAVPLASVQPGTWVELAGTRLDSAKPPGANVYGVVHAWSGGVYDTERDRLVVWGGGHNDYSGNEVYVLSLTSEPQAWSRLTHPSSPAANNTPRAVDGRPVSRHTYNLLDYLPPPHDKMMSCAIGSQHSNGYAAPGVDFYSFQINGFTGQPWSVGPTAPRNGYPGGMCAYNPATQTMWYQPVGGNEGILQSFNPASNAWKQHAENRNEANATPAINTRDNYMITVGAPFSGSAGLVYFDLTQSTVTPVRITAMSGATEITNEPFPGLAYVESENVFYAWSGGRDIYKLTPPSNRTSGTWVWSKVTLDPSNAVTPTAVAGVKVAGYKIGTFGRFRYVPRFHGFIVVNSHDENAYFFKLAGSGSGGNPTPPAPQVTLTAAPASVAAGGSSTLSWSSVDATTCLAGGGWSGSRTPSGSQSVSGIAQTTSYSLTCTGQGGSAAATATVTVTPTTPPAPAPTVSLAANPASVTAGGSTTLSWSSTNATSCTAGGGWSGARATSGTQGSGALNATASFTLSCTGAGGTASASVNVTVTPVVTPPGGKTYSTTFDLTENPISEGGVWRKASNSLTPVRTANGLAFGTNGVTNTYDDSYALLSGFGPNQTAEAVVQRGSIPGGGITHEIELWLRFTDGSFGARGYEALFAEFGGVQIVRWDGNNTFVPLSLTGGTGGLGRPLATGDVLRASAIGNVISMHINGTLVAQAVDATYPTGQPGIGFFIRPGGNNAGLAITSYTVTSEGATPAPQPTVSLSANPTSVASGGAASLSWTSTHATGCTASGGWTGARPPSGGESTGALTQARTYTLTCTGAGGSASASTTVAVQAPPAPAVNLSANPSALTAGGSTTLSWSSTNATACTASGGWSGTKGTSGTQSSGALNANTTFTLSCSGAGGTRQASTTVTVTPAAPVPTVSLTANPASVTAGGSTTLAWSSTNAASCTASGGWSGTKASAGTQASGALNASTSFTLSCSGAGGTASATTSVAVTPAVPPSGKTYSTGFDVSETPISEGGLWRRASNAFTNVSVANGIAFGTNRGTGAFDDSYALLSGFGPDQTVEAVVHRAPGTLPEVTHNASLLLRFSDSTSGIRGYAVQFAYYRAVQVLRWDGQGNPTVLPVQGDSQYFRGFVSGDVVKASIVGSTISVHVNGTLVARSTDATYASGQPGMSFFVRPGTTGNAFGFTSYSATSAGAAPAPQPTVSLSATPASVVPGTASNLSWTSTHATTCTASGGWSGARSPSGSQSTGVLTGSRTYTLTCTGAGGSASASTTVAVAAAPVPAPTVSLAASPGTVSAGGNVTLNWQSTNANSCIASGGWSGSKALNGSQPSGPLSAGTTFTLTCSGPGGSRAASASVTVTPPPGAPAAPVVTLTPSATAVSAGSQVTLDWSTTNATACAASGGWSGARGTSGRATVGPLSQTTSFGLSCSGPGGTSGATAQVTVTLLPSGAITNVTLISQSSAAQGQVPVTFGHVFKPGQLPPATGVAAQLLDGTPVPLQVDVKARHRDGSLRHAILTTRLGSLGAGASQTVALVPGPLAGAPAAVSLQSLLDSAYDTTLSLSIGGIGYTASAREALRGSAVRPWLAGAEVSEWLAAAPLKNAAGTAHPHLAAYFHVRAYAGLARVRTDVVIENTWTFVANPGNITYDVQIAVPGKPAYARTALTHYAKTRWHRRMWWGAQPEVYAKLDKDYLQDTQAIPKYEDLQPTEATLSRVRRSTEPMSNGDHTPNMEDTGFQNGIGPLPLWDALYAVSTDVRAFDSMLANADGGSAYSAHYRDQVTGLPISIDNHPRVTLADESGSVPQVPSGGGSPYNVVWASHQPSIGFLAYLVTGDHYYLEEMQFWSSYNLVWTNAEYRGRDKGWWYTGSIRGQAWAYRSLAQAAYLTPDEHPLKGYFHNKLMSNLQRDTELYVSPGGPHRNNLGAMKGYEGHDQYRFFDYFMSWVVQYMVDLGYGEAVPFRDYKVRFPIGLMGSGANEYCYQAASLYFWKAGPGGDAFYPDFRTMFDATVPGAQGIACGTAAMVAHLRNTFGSGQIVGNSPFAMVGDQTSTGYYFANLQPALASAADSGVPGGELAWQRSRLSGVHPDYRDVPIWAVVPRKLPR